MRRKRLVFCNKLITVGTVVAAIVCCNFFLVKLEREKEQKKAQTQALIEESKDEMQKRLDEALMAIGYTQENIEEISASAAQKYADGIYAGEAEGYGGLVQVEVSVSAGSISDITILYAGREDAAYLDMAMRVVDEMLDEGDADNIDTVTGATFSSKGIINAVRAALEVAENEKE